MWIARTMADDVARACRPRRTLQHHGDRGNAVPPVARPGVDLGKRVRRGDHDERRARSASCYAVAHGLDVYAFLIGIIALAELGRAERVFEWAADRVMHVARGSQARLFGLLYVVGALVTALLSNDTTVVVLTPAVFAMLAQTDAQPLPYLYACAFVANAASFVLPFSNPANVVVFGNGLPRLLPWIAHFGLAAVAATAITYGVLRLALRESLAAPLRHIPEDLPMTRGLRMALLSLGGACAALVGATLLGVDVGYVAFGSAIVATALVAAADRDAPGFVLRHLSWQVVPLVAALFVIVQALDRAGALHAVAALLSYAGSIGGWYGLTLVTVATTVACNLLNNLPIALITSYAAHSATLSQAHLDAAVVAIDLGPNLSVTGSLATVLWLIMLRRDGIEVTPLQWMRLGILTVVPSLIAAMLLVR